MAGLTGPAIKPYGDLRPADQAALKTARLKGFELYHLTKDVAETEDLSEMEPARLADLQLRMKTIYESVQAESPTWPAWTFPGIEGKRIRALRDALREAAPAK